MGNFMKSSNRSQISVSSAITNGPQGGGNKKAGFPYLVGRGQWTSIALQTNRNGVYGCNCPLKTLQFTSNPNVRPSRPIGIRPHSYPSMF